MSAKLDRLPLSKFSLFSTVAFIVGVFLRLILQNAQLVLLGVSFFVSFPPFLIFKDKELRWLVFFCLLFFILGSLRADFSEDRIKGSKLQEFNGGEVVLEGTIVKAPKITQRNQRLVVRIEKIRRNLSADEFISIGSANEKALFYAPIYPSYQYGDKIMAVGSLEEPPIFDDFNYKQYLAQKGIFSVMFSPQISRIEGVSGGSWFYKEILKAKSKLQLGIEQNFPLNQEILLGAIILGDKSRLTEELKNILNKSGIRHLTAISGMHITILVNLLMLLFLGLGFWRKQAFLLTTAFILFFVLMTGCQPSTIRASIMGFLFLLGQMFGRGADSSRMIVLGAALMLAINPFLLLEAGFQLSFLAIMGINYLGPIFSRWLKKIPNKVQLRNILAMSFAAQIFTLPVLVYNFGYISLIAPITNLLVLPLLPFIIIFGFLSAFFGIFSHILALIFVFPCWLLLNYLLKVADFLSSFSFASLSLRISWVWIIIFYIFLIYFIWSWKKEHRFKILGP